jgi:hypothetical protein
MGHEEWDLPHLHSTNKWATSTITTNFLCKRSFGSKSHGIILEKMGPLREDVEILPYTCIQKTPYV